MSYEITLPKFPDRLVQTHEVLGADGTIVNYSAEATGLHFVVYHGLHVYGKMAVKKTTYRPRPTNWFWWRQLFTESVEWSIEAEEPFIWGGEVLGPENSTGYKYQLNSDSAERGFLLKPALCNLLFDQIDQKVLEVYQEATELAPQFKKEPQGLSLVEDEEAAIDKAIASLAAAVA